MAMRELGKMQEADLSEIWPHEARNFTVWLSEPKNLQLLGDALGLTLEFVGREVSVGDFKLDILAKEAEDEVSVVIENQLYWTNHRHLGQTITYAADKEAKYVIWIASYFRPEHRAAIDWLNELAPDKVWFFAVEIHAIQIDDSLPAADFRPVAVPKGWKGSAPVEAPSTTVIKHQAFFKPIVAELEQEDFTLEEEEQRKGGYCWYWFDHGHERLWYTLGLDDEGAWVCLWTKGVDSFSNRVYESLWEHEAEIAEEIGSKLDWYDPDSSDWPGVTLAKGNGSIDDPPERLDETRTWMLETLPKFREVFNPRLERILAELDAE